MLSLVWFFILMRTVMMSYADSADIIQVSRSSGESMLLQPSLQSVGMGTRGDFRWTHLHLLLHNRTTKCHHGRCELLRNGSLRFSQVQPQDSGTYTLEVYDESGVIKEKKVFQLQVKDVSSSVKISSLIFCFCLLLLLLFITFFIRRKRRTRRLMVSGLTEDNIYMAMHANHSSKGKREEEEEKKKEEESLYVPCHPAIPAEQPENVYM